MAEGRLQLSNNFTNDLIAINDFANILKKL